MCLCACGTLYVRAYHVVPPHYNIQSFFELGARFGKGCDKYCIQMCCALCSTCALSSRISLTLITPSSIRSAYGHDSRSVLSLSAILSSYIRTQYLLAKPAKFQANAGTRSFSLWNARHLQLQVLCSKRAVSLYWFPEV